MRSAGAGVQTAAECVSLAFEQTFEAGPPWWRTEAAAGNQAVQLCLPAAQVSVEDLQQVENQLSAQQVQECRQQQDARGCPGKPGISFLVPHSVTGLEVDSSAACHSSSSPKARPLCAVRQRTLAGPTQSRPQTGQD